MDLASYPCYLIPAAGDHRFQGNVSRGRHFLGMSEHSRPLLPGARWQGKAPVPVPHALGWKCVGVWSITMVATHLPQKARDAHVISFTRPSSRLSNSFFPVSKIVTAKESEREGRGTRLLNSYTTNSYTIIHESHELMSDH